MAQLSAVPQITIIDAVETIFAPWFKNPSTWSAWFAVLKTIFGLPLDAAELELFRQYTGRAIPPAGGVTEAWLVCGRRAGKSLILALIAIYLATCCDWTSYLTPGERATVMILATDRRQARAIFRYARAMLRVVAKDGEDEDYAEVAAAGGLYVERETAESLDLSNRITIEIQTASFRGARSYSIVAALADEIAFWRDESSANPDVEILAALRPAMATIPGARLLCASSPYARRGALWEAYKRWYAKDEAPALVWKAPTKSMNPTVPDSVIAEAYERDPASAGAEYGAEFRTDVETFLPREVIDAATVPDRHELPPISGVRYMAFTDPSGGAADSFTLAIAHEESAGRLVLDAIRERVPPFSPEAVVAEYAELLRSYGVREVVGDRYAGEWPREQFRKHGVEYIPSTRSASDIYREFLPPMNAGKIDLLDHARLAGQLAGLERRTARGGRDSIDHAPGGHDDVAVAAAGALVNASTQHAFGNFGYHQFMKRLAEQTDAQMNPPREPPQVEPARGSVEWMLQREAETALA